MSLSPMLGQPGGSGTNSVRVRAWLLWLSVAAAIVIGVVLYFKYARSVVPLVA